ncbi:MAG: DUF4386 family protein [Anaerolineae bacterium]|nr:DUF4386 family protein [Anaerolineae bacterium]NIN96437.1 DUF4386 family protein [Anaerolineae bacterium]
MLSSGLAADCSLHSWIAGGRQERRTIVSAIGRVGRHCGPPLAYFSVFDFMAALNFNFEALGNPLLAVQEMAGQGTRLKWEFLADELGYYLLLVPLALVLWNWLKPKSPNFVTLFTLAGLGYLILGGLGAAIFGTALAATTDAYAQATGTEQQIQTELYLVLTSVVQGGIWDRLGSLLAALWWIGIGSLIRSQRRGLGWATVILGASTLLSWLGSIVEVEALQLPGTMVYLLLAPAWAAYLGVDLIRRPIAAVDQQPSSNGTGA